MKNLKTKFTVFSNLKSEKGKIYWFNNITYSFLVSSLFIGGLCSVWAFPFRLINCIGFRKLRVFDDINLVWTEELLKAKAYPDKWSFGVNFSFDKISDTSSIFFF